MWGSIGYTQDVCRVGESWQVVCTAVQRVLFHVGMSLVMHFLVGRGHISSEELSQPLPQFLLAPDLCFLLYVFLRYPAAVPSSSRPWSLPLFFYPFTLLLPLPNPHHQLLSKRCKHLLGTYLIRTLWPASIGNTTLQQLKWNVPPSEMRWNCKEREKDANQAYWISVTISYSFKKVNKRSFFLETFSRTPLSLAFQNHLRSFPIRICFRNSLP